MAPLGVDVTFTCNATTTVIWIINYLDYYQDKIIVGSYFQDLFTKSSVYSPLTREYYIELHVHTNIINYGMKVRCGAVDPISGSLIEKSEEVHLLVHGK